MYFLENVHPAQASTQAIKEIEAVLAQAEETLEQLPQEISFLKAELSKWKAINEVITDNAKHLGFDEPTETAN